MLLSFFFLTFCFTEAQAQKFSAMANFQIIGNNRIQGVDSTNLNYDKTVGASLNLRFFNKKKWAFRAGVGFERLKYNGLNVNFEDALRDDLTAIIGLEKHFKILFLRPYIGAFVPIRFNLDNSFSDNRDMIVNQFKDGDVTAGFSLVGGANIKLLGILNLGAEFTVGWDRFKETILDNLDDTSQIELKQLNTGVDITLGISF